jgi:transcriptional regulator with XRE-family HTH domain
MAHATAGTLVRDWRVRRHRSQMELALATGVSPRHLSFVETGRSKASPELLLALAEHLEIPLRERNTLLLAGGYAPRYPRTSLDSPEMARVLATLQAILERHDPYPGLVIDRYWNVILANSGALGLIQGLPKHVLGPPANVFRVSLHPDGLAGRTSNFEDWAYYLLGQLHRSTIVTGDPAFERLLEEVSAYPAVVAIGDWRSVSLSAAREVLVPFRLKLDGTELSMFTTLTVFGTPQDVTVAELAIDLFYPADDATEALLRTERYSPGPAQALPNGQPLPNAQPLPNGQPLPNAQALPNG